MSGDARPTDQELFYDWNSEGIQSELPSVKLLDETLRDGIQCPSVTDPPIEAKLEMIRLMDALGVHHIDVGLPGAGKRARQDVVTIVEMIRDEGLQIQPACAARTLRHDIMRDLCQPHGQPRAVQAAVGAPGQSSGGEAQGASTPKAATPKPRRRKVKNSAFRRAERERMLFDRGESGTRGERFCGTLAKL